MPALVVDGTVIAQSASIMRYGRRLPGAASALAHTRTRTHTSPPRPTARHRYIGKLGGLYPTDDVQAAFVDSLIDQEGMPWPART